MDNNSRVDHTQQTKWRISTNVIYHYQQWSQGFSDWFLYLIDEYLIQRKKSNYLYNKHWYKGCKGSYDPVRFY